MALVNDEYNFQRGGLEVTESGLEKWSCGAAINTAYASSCVSGQYGFGIFNPDTFWGPASLADSYGLWKMAYINGDSSSESIQFNVSGDLFTLPAGPVGFALHLDDTTTDYQIRPDQTS